MRSLLYVLTALGVLGLAFWAYRENYATQETLAQTQSLQNRIGRARQRLGVLHAEWAYLNRPDRLRELADLNFGRLGLLPLRPDQFGRVDEVTYPRPPMAPLEISNGVDVSTMEAQNP